MGENVIEVQTLMTMAENYEAGGEFALFSLDIEKAFDSINWEFMARTLEGFGFPPQFMQWIRVIQNNVQLRISNNGYYSAPINVVKGTAQGDSLSPFLFILMMETLAIHLRQNKRVQGIHFHDQEKIISLTADDTMFVLKCTQKNLENLLESLNHFQTVSGLKINFDKSVLIVLHENPQWVN